MRGCGSIRWPAGDFAQGWIEKNDGNVRATMIQAADLISYSAFVETLSFCLFLVYGAAVAVGVRDVVAKTMGSSAGLFPVVLASVISSGIARAIGTSIWAARLDVFDIHYAAVFLRSLAKHPLLWTTLVSGASALLVIGVTVLFKSDPSHGTGR